MTPAVLTGGFADAPRDASRAFRAALNAMARPGRIETLSGAAPPEPLSLAAGTLLLTLADGTTPVHLAASHDLPAVRDWLTFHCGAPLVSARDAVFAVGRWEALRPVSRFAIGTPEYPDRAATLIVEVSSLDLPTAKLTGPGIRTTSTVALPEITAFAANNALFPLGFDCYLTADDRLVGLPRSSRVEAL